MQSIFARIASIFAFLFASGIALRRAKTFFIWALYCTYFPENLPYTKGPTALSFGVLIATCAATSGLQVPDPEEALVPHTELVPPPLDPLELELVEDELEEVDDDELEEDDEEEDDHPLEPLVAEVVVVVQLPYPYP
jgi:hypothetical protein